MREQLAELCHEQWSGWVEYMFSWGCLGKKGTLIIPQWAVERWTRQMRTPYSELSDSEQDSDRKEADKFLEILGKKRRIK